MADLVKKLNKAGVGLHPDEMIVAAMVLHPSGMARRVAMGGIGAAVASRLGKDDDGSIVSDSGMAAQMPDGPLIVGLTPQRALIYSQSGFSGKPKAVELAMSRRDIAAVEVGKDKLGASVTLAFSDRAGVRDTDEEQERRRLRRRALLITSRPDVAGHRTGRPNRFDAL